MTHKHTFDPKAGRLDGFCRDEMCNKPQCVLAQDGSRCLAPAQKNGYCRKHQDKMPWHVRFPRGLVRCKLAGRSA